jgi:hypothetical protein
MYFEKKEISWCGVMNPPEDRVISMYAGLVVNHDHTSTRGNLVIMKFSCFFLLRGYLNESYP